MSMVASAPGRVQERGGYAAAARELLRNTLLDAARAQLQSRGWSEITMGDIATAAGVSRQTLYNEFGSREQFAQAFMLRESDRFLAAVDRAVGEHLDNPELALRAAFDVFLTAAAQDPLVRTMVFGEGGELLPLLTVQGEGVVAYATTQLAAIITAGWPGVAGADVALLAEGLVRLALSYAALPAGPTAMSADSVTRLLAPYISHVLAEAGD